MVYIIGKYESGLNIYFKNVKEAFDNANKLLKESDTILMEGRLYAARNESQSDGSFVREISLSKSIKLSNTAMNKLSSELKKIASKMEREDKPR